MRVYIWTDIEGVAGMIDWDDYASEGPYAVETRRRMMRILTGEVNAAATAAFESGATLVLVKDSHGPGNSLYFEELHPDVELILGRKGLPHPWAGLDETFDASLLIGAHPMEGTREGILPHTKYRINGIELGDAGLFAAISASLGVPLVFASGDYAAMQQLRSWIPDLHTRSTKQAFSPYAARTLVPAKAQALIAAGVKQALAARASIRPLALTPPYRVEYGGRSAEGADLLRTFMGIYDPEGRVFGCQDPEPERSVHLKKIHRWYQRFTAPEGESQG